MPIWFSRFRQIISTTKLNVDIKDGDGILRIESIEDVTTNVCKSMTKLDFFV
jgi:hypothetical protein